MTQLPKNDDRLFDFAKIRERYEKLSRGDQAQLGKRIGFPDDLAMMPAFYKLFPGITPSEWHYRAAFITPFIRHSDASPELGKFIGTLERSGKIGNMYRRILQIIRAAPQQDVIYLRRLLMRFDKPAINWNKSGLAQLFSTDEKKNAEGKKKFVEQYFIARYSAEKGE
jgi:CRISPR system Cascade subunit CasB